MKEDDRQRTIRLKLTRQEVEPRAVIPTGFRSLDAALGVGGLPRGRLVEIFGPPACGKSTLALQIVAHRQRTGATAGWIDADHTFDPGYARSLGIDLDRMPVVQPGSAEQALEIGRTLVLSGALEVLAIDSAAALVPEQELEFGLGEGGRGLHSRVLSDGLRRMAVSAARTGTCVIVVNQVRSRPRARGAEPETSAGGPPLKLHAAVRIALNPVAGRVRFRILKNKTAGAFAEGQLTWHDGSGLVETL